MARRLRIKSLRKKVQAAQGRLSFRKAALIAGLCLGLALFLDVAVYLVYPRIAPLAKENPETTAYMEIRKEQWADAGEKVTLRKQWRSLKSISPYLVKAVLISEDDKFWSHDGFDYEAIQKAVETNLAKGRFRLGASTITQQLARNLFLSPDKSILRKAKEAILAWRLENELEKRRILELYLNLAEWGKGVFGAEAAARHHYGKSAASLGPGEACRLAAVLPNPLRHSPRDGSRFVEKRANHIRRVMSRRGIQ